MKRYDIAVIGGGILGVSLSYFMAHLNPDTSIAVIEKESGVAQHASGRNTGKVHAPYLYHPKKKRLSAKSALLGYDMWERYAGSKGLPFKKDGVIEVALNDEQTGTLKKYQKWGIQNGLQDNDMDIIDGVSFQKIEPNVRCVEAFVCRKDASVDYKTITQSLAADAASCDVDFLYQKTAATQERNDYTKIILNNTTDIEAKFLINAGGGQAIDIAHGMNVGQEYTDVHFRGEYWISPKIYNGLTSMSVYSVPQNPQYPFLDPHWILRHNGTCEIGPNAVPVFGPYAYDIKENVQKMIPKTREMLQSGARKILFDAQFRRMAADEMWSSVSKRVMINRVKKFIPRLDAKLFKERGTAGIRSNVIDKDGHFVSDPVILHGSNSFHVLNYNSPGATGALPFAAYLVDYMHENGLYQNERQDAVCGLWKFSDIIESMKA